MVAGSYARKRAEKTIPKNDIPEIARTVPSLVVEDDDVAEAPDPVAVAALDLTVANEPVARAEELVALTVGRAVKRAELVKVLQLDEAGIRAV